MPSSFAQRRIKYAQVTKITNRLSTVNQPLPCTTQATTHGLLQVSPEFPYPAAIQAPIPPHELPATL